MPRFKAIFALATLLLSAHVALAQAIGLDPSLKPTLEKYLQEMREHNAKTRRK